MSKLLPIVALVLLASVVTGRESAAPYEPVQPALEKPRAETPAFAEDLDPLKLVRGRTGAAVQDVFASQKIAPTPPPVAAPALPAPRADAAPAPVTPPLPFAYLGRMNKGDRVTVYLLRNREMVIAENGVELDSVYRVDAVSDTAVQFTYLPLGTRQTLNLPAAP